ncbi:MAG TPA: DUF1501 domain-containing protein [Planctomycetaceae bacterium]|nr:DUF1501 domain-containing protein [Planctomycetaceae bacterium]
MLTILDHSPSLCDRVSRRMVLRAGAATAFASGAGFVGPALSARGASTVAPKAKSCILLFLLGGPPQHSTWDPKPNAPAEVRGEFGPIPTTADGVQICELLPQTARVMDHVALLRAVSTGDNAHSSSGYQMLTGQPHIPLNAENVNPGPPNNFPTIGAVLQHLHRGDTALPPSVRLPHQIFNTDLSVWPGQDSGWLGHAADPWLFNCEPASANFDVPQFRLQADVGLGRLNQRQSLLEQLEHGLREIDRGPANATYHLQREQALTLLGAPRARQACDLNREPPTVRDRYGRDQFGQSVLLARRLVDAGVNFVQVNWFRGPDEPSNAPCWDSHAKEADRLKNVLMPSFDTAYSALITDLVQTGKIDETLVVVMAEFGRTPRFNGAGGRDHWGHVFSLAVAGGGIRGGVVHGSSDAQGGHPSDGKVSAADVTATIFDRLGYHPDTELRDPLSRPLPISRGEPISAILA